MARGDYRLRVSREVEDDLEAIEAVDADSADSIFAWLEWIGGQQQLLGRLLEHGYSDDDVSVSKWLSTWRGSAAKYLWRLKFWSLEELGIQYRIIYIFEVATRTFWVLGVLPRTDETYEPDSPTTKRIFAAADRVVAGHED